MSHVERLFTTRRSREILYFPITKCGCTFVKNLLWAIDHKAPHGEPLRVHRDDKLFLRATAHGYSENEIRGKPCAFVILRNPVDRFLSLYFDKVIGAGQFRFIPLRKTLVEGYGLLADPASVADHRHNCEVLIRWIARNLGGPSELRRDPHWRPLAERVETIRTLDLKVILLEDMERSVRWLLEPHAPEVAALMRGMERNATHQPVTRDEVLSPELEAMIAGVYGEDLRLTRKVREHWDAARPAGAGAIPRYGDIFPPA